MERRKGSTICNMKRRTKVAFGEKLFFSTLIEGRG
jgi:hypothetical protein